MNRVASINRGMNDMKPPDSVEIPSLEGKVSPERARDLYRVAVDLETRELDEQATAELRT